MGLAVKDGASKIKDAWFDLDQPPLAGGDIPVAPAIIGMILGPMAEQQFRRALAISQGDPSVFVTRPISATLLLLALFAMLAVPLVRAYQARKARLDS